MRILANFVKKVSTAQYENETFMMTVEAESEFNNISEVSDYLFAQARAAVERQITGAAEATTPGTTIPPAAKAPESAPQQQQEKKAPSNGNTQPQQPVTEKQKGMLFRLLRDCFETRTEEQAFLKEQAGVERVDSLTRKQASRAIEALMDRQRNAA